MFGHKPFLVKLILLWTILTFILVESSRQKKDVHHMIILNETPPAARTRRHKNHIHNNSSRRRKPKIKTKYRHTSSSEESFEDNSFEEHIPVKNKKQQHKRSNHHKSRNEHLNHKHKVLKNNNRLPTEAYSVPEAKWTPMTSQEFFGKGSQYHQYPPIFPGGYQKSVLHFSQPITTEITTPLALPSNTFVSFESTLYPPLNSPFHINTKNIPQQSTIGTGTSYRPFDYSILEDHLPKVITHQKNASGGSTPFSIVVNNSTEAHGKNEKENNIENSKKPVKKVKIYKGRGVSRFGTRINNKN